MATTETLNYSPADVLAHSPLRAQSPSKTHPTATLSDRKLFADKPELAGFIEAWRYKPEKQVKEEMASYCMETLRVSDPYRFLLTPNGELFSPTARCRVKDIVTTNTHVGRLEYEALGKIEHWAATNEVGAIVWISPPDQELYPDVSKIIISEIEQIDGVKTLFNRAIVLDIDQEKCLKLAADLANYSTNRPLLSSIDQIRCNPLVLNTNVHWTYILEELVADLSLSNVRTGEDVQIKEKTLQQAENIYREFFTKGETITAKSIAVEMNNRNMVGSFGTSCPTRTAFSVFAESAGETTFPCPKCEKGIPKGKGLTICPHCGARKEDYGNCD